MQIISVLTALAAFKFAAALPSGPETGIVTHVTTDEIPAVFKVSNETDITARDVEKRASFGVYLCANAPWKEPCQHITSQSNQCIKLDSALAGQVSSIGPDQGAYCRFFFSDNCVDNNGCEHFDLTSPGYSDLSLLGPSCNGKYPNDRVRSYFCVQA
ncbi:hypothetical protein QBC32DRAFT_269149 [Pseudoneurospora amorphoporcata]|uniref:Uncharacterized protein n=1 Tax=Pseudoneurospora amorphoporcata TaxID=241081 RepID=A0AAN6NMH4_9PEZI|nr:hypothetical protein QBC32DRAFT_269149 [Pseudoneurospora amorphoporcata]